MVLLSSLNMYIMKIDYSHREAFFNDIHARVRVYFQVNLKHLYLLEVIILRVSHWLMSNNIVHEILVFPSQWQQLQIIRTLLIEQCVHRGTKHFFKHTKHGRRMFRGTEHL